VFRARDRGGEQTVKFKVDKDSRVVLQKSIKGIRVASDKLRRLRRTYAKGRAAAVAPPRFLMVADGGIKSANAWLEHFSKEPQVRLLDKISFTLGVAIICLSQYVIIKVIC
jgi:hypothetical protein